MIAIGEKAPDFDLPLTNGGAIGGPPTPGTPAHITLSALAPRRVVLYFYPKDDTPGCTTEALDFTRLLPGFTAAGAVVLGISKDSPAQHEKFCARHGLGVALLSDVSGETCAAYGAWVEKRLYGRVSMGIERRSVLIDETGRVAQIWPKVKVAGHAEAVLAALHAMGPACA